MLSHSRSAIIALLIASSVALAAGCSSGTPVDPGAGQMHAGALDATEPETPIPFEEVSMHVSDVTLEGGEYAVIITPKGTIELDLYPEAAPNTAATFVELARSGYFDGIKFHRVVAGFVVQGGDPQTKDLTSDEVVGIVERQDRNVYSPGEPRLGMGNAGWNLAAEFNERKHLEGTVAMARALDPDSAGTQFYICLAPQPRLDGQYTVFGQVAAGMDVVKAIGVGDEIVSVTIKNR
jgi:peptidyl-prolyl cis-trans isomerase B (cyclophilin B)